MSASVLQAFIRASLIDLHGDDTRRAKLQESATEMAAEFALRPLSLAIPALMAVLREEDVNPPDAFREISRAIESRWSTYHSVFRGGKANTLYRGVALQALAEAIESQPQLGVAIALLMRNFRTALAFGKYASAIQLVVEVAEAAFASEAQAGALPKDTSTTLPAVAKATKIDRPALLKRLEAAVGPHNRAGEAGNNPNPQWPNAGNPWSYDFSDRLMPVIADHIDVAISEAAKFDQKNQQGVASTIAARTSIEPAIRRSIKLLWWRQSLYSTSADQSYRQLGPFEAVIHAVADLASHLPDAYESAADFFLSEAVLALGLGKDMHDFGKLQGADSKARFALSGRLALQTPAGLVLTGLVLKDGSAPLCAPTLTYEGWAVWLLREFVAVRALEQIQTEADTQDAPDE